MTTHLNVTAGERTWQCLITLLHAAKDRGEEEATSNPAILLTASGAMAAAAAATHLLSPQGLHGLDDVELGEETTTLTFVELLHAAEEATLRHPIEELPRGASRIIIDLHALIQEVTP